MNGLLDFRNQGDEFELSQLHDQINRLQEAGHPVQTLRVTPEQAGHLEVLLQTPGIQEWEGVTIEVAEA